MTEQYDFVVLGGGSAGYAAARTAAALGLKTAVVDGADELGGLCILRGCMPSKTLIESADRNLTLRRAAEFGLAAKFGEVDAKFIRGRKRRLIREFAEYRQGQLADGRFALLRGIGKFERLNGGAVNMSVEIPDGKMIALSAGSVLIATGSTINVPTLPGLAEHGFWTSDTILDAAEIPPSFIVLGGGAIALEMAHYLEAIGRKVTVLQRNTQVLTGIDADIAGVVQEAFVRRGMKVQCGTNLLRVEKSEKGKRVIFTQDGCTHHAEAAEILLALGRRPAVDGLGLENVGVERNRSGRIEVKTSMQTTNSRIFAAGDVCGPLEVVHLAIQQGEIAAKNAFALHNGKKETHTMDYRCALFGVFTHPQVAAVGLSETEAKARGVEYFAATYPFNDHGKSMVMGETEGFVKLLCDASTGALIGGSVAGPEATELIHEIVVAMHLGASVAQLAAAPHYHPTLSEIWTYPAEELSDRFEAGRDE